MPIELNTANKEGTVGRQEGPRRQVGGKEEGGKRTSVGDSTTLKDASFWKKIASTNMCAVPAEKEDMASQHVPPKRSKDPTHGMVPNTFVTIFGTLNWTSPRTQWTGQRWQNL